MQQVPLSLSPASVATFSSFCPGPNRLAWQHLQSSPLPSAPVYLWGPRGSGKTHLLRALAQACQSQGRVAGWWDAAKTDGSHTAATLEPFNPAWAVLLLDNVERLDAAAQQVVFAWMVEAQTQGLTWVAAGSLPPVDLPLRDDLRSRIGWGHTFALEPLSEAETRAVLYREAQRRGIFLSDEVMDYLLSRLERDLGFLMALLDRLDDFALSQHRAVTIPLLRQMLASPAVQAPA